MIQDPFYWNALRNMVWYVLAVFVEYAIAFSLALLLNAQIGHAGSSCRLPHAAHAEPGRRQLDDRQVADGEPLRPGGDLCAPARLGQPGVLYVARDRALSIMVMDAWTFIPLMMVMLLAGLALLAEVMEAEVDGANPWQRFWKIVFPLMMPVSITAIVIRIIFKLKLADIIINVTAGAGRRYRLGDELHLSIATARTSATARCSR